MNQLLDQYRLSYTSTSEQANFTAFLVWAEQVYDLNPGLQDLRRSRLLFKRRRFSVDWVVFNARWRINLVDWLAQNVEHTA